MTSVTGEWGGPLRRDFTTPLRRFRDGGAARCLDYNDCVKNFLAAAIFFAGRASAPGERLAVAVQSVAPREDVELEAVGHAELVVDAAKMVAQRVLADV
jgi:hypothetical protein